MKTLAVLIILSAATVAGAQPLAVGEALPAGTPWAHSAQADTVLTAGGWVYFDDTGVGVGTVDAKADDLATVWLYLAPAWSTDGTVRARIGPIRLRSDDGPRTLVPPGVRVHAIQILDATDSVIIAVRN